MAGLGPVGVSSNYRPSAPRRSTGAVANGIVSNERPANGISADALAAWKRNDALNQQQNLAASNAALQAQQYGVNVKASGQGPTGQWAIGAEPQEPANYGPGGTASRPRALTSRGGSDGGAGGGDGYEDLTMSNYQSAYSGLAGAPPPVSPISMLNRKPAEDAAYGRAKDQAGAEARGAADQVSDELSARGIAGGGAEAALLGTIMNKAQGQLGEVNREQAIDYMRRADNVQDTNYSGAVQQRGQTINAEQQRQSNAMRLTELLRRRRRTPLVV